MVAVADDDHAKIPRGNMGAPGTGGAGPDCPCRGPAESREADSLAARRVGWGGSGGQPAGWRTRSHVSRSPGVDFDDHAHRAEPGDGTVRRGTGVLLSAGPA